MCLAVMHIHSQRHSNQMLIKTQVVVAIHTSEGSGRGRAIEAINDAFAKFSKQCGARVKVMCDEKLLQVLDFVHLMREVLRKTNGEHLVLAQIMAGRAWKHATISMHFT